MLQFLAEVAAARLRPIQTRGWESFASQNRDFGFSGHWAVKRKRACSDLNQNIIAGMKHYIFGVLGRREQNHVSRIPDLHGDVVPVNVAFLLS